MARRSRDRDRGRSQSGFVYRRRGEDSVRKRSSEVTGGGFDSYIKDTVELYKPKVGDCLIRILPPPNAAPPQWMSKWGDTYEHYGIDIYVHYGIGPDNSAYACASMIGEDCAICDERASATKQGEPEEYIASLKPTRRVLFYLIDRDNEKTGPQAWAAPWTIDRDIVALMRDKRTGEVLYIDDPEDGYDVEFERKGSGLKTEYVGMRISRNPSPLGEDSWLEYIEENPLSDIVKFYDYDHVKAILEGKKPSRSNGRSRRDDEDEEESRRARSREDGQDEEDQVELTYEAVKSMSFRELSRLIRDEDLDINPVDFETDEELADEICIELELKPKKQRERSRSREETEPSRSRARARLREERDD